jgi:hypothetical protein
MVVEAPAGGVDLEQHEGEGRLGGGSENPRRPLLAEETILHGAEDLNQRWASNEPAAKAH